MISQNLFDRNVTYSLLRALIMATKFTRPALMNFLVLIVFGTFVEISAGRYISCDMF